MVKKVVKSTSSVINEDSQILNDNGKRPADGENKDPTKPKRIRNLFRQPTVNELNRLQETETLFNSNLFRLQIDEVLEEVQIKEKTDKKFEQWFSDFKTYLNSIQKDDTEYDLSEKSLSKKLKVKFPISNTLDKTKCIFKFHKFKDIKVVGSFALGCAINSKLCIDIQITVPAETYTKNDSINYRYHKKRAAYLAKIASHLSKYESIEDLKYTWLNGSETTPVLDFSPLGKLAKHFTVRLHLVCEAEAYKLHRFSPLRNNVREAWLLKKETQENASEIGPPTPYYNSSVLSDLTAAANHEFLEQTVSGDNLKKAITLLKIWLRQRNLRVSGHVISCYVAYLVQIKRINNIMSSYQIIRNVWIALKTTDWDTKGISLHKGGDSPPLTDFIQNFPVVFVDTTGYYNLCWNVTKGTYNALKRECVLAVEMLDKTNINSFIPLFMVPLKPLTQFDQIVRFKNLSKLKESVISRAALDARLNYGTDQLSLVTDCLHNLLAKGLGDRVELILNMNEAEFSWDVNKTVENAKEGVGFDEKLSFGLILNIENSTNIVMKGPPPNLPEAEEFRAFWGDKSELRRFEDGSINETCLWDGDTAADRRAVTQQIVDYLLLHKYDMESSSIFHTTGHLESLLHSKLYAASGEDSSRAVNEVFHELRKELMALTQLPLDINAVYGVSPVFSHCAPCPPAPRAPPSNPWRRARSALLKHIARDDGAVSLPPYTPVAEAVVELGHSGKWPGDIAAFRCLKAAFHVQLAARLTAQHSLQTQPHYTHVDVLKQGLVFRLRIAHPKEITLLRRETHKGVVKYRDTEESVALLRDTVLMPRLTGALHGVGGRHPSFSATARLFSRWLCCHLLSPPHFPAPLPSLLSAAPYTRPEPLSPPATPLAGLVRVLQVLAETDWRTQMLLLDFNGDLTREELTELDRKFSSRENLSPYMYICTSYDGDTPAPWCTPHPSIHVVRRAQALAKAALKHIQDRLMGDMDGNILGAFIPSLKGYDVLIHLHPSVVPYSSERIDRKPILKALPTDFCEEIPVVEFDPVKKYLDELRSAYDEFALFFHDMYGGDVIAVLWKPDIKQPREFQLSSANCLEPHSESGEVKYLVNTSAIMADFRTMGEGLVKDITLCT